MNLQQIQSIELACGRLCNQFAVFNDAGKHAELVALFTEDGRYARPTDPDNFVVGREAILAAFKARPKDKITRHLITNVVVDVTGSRTAKGICESPRVSWRLQSLREWSYEEIKEVFP